uniref:Ppm1e protein n=1 Tax=Fopius arisanus TaxID=64838 RepID=A0A0C9R2P2_9HYME
MDQVDGDYLGSYRRFLVDFVGSMNPDDQLPVKMTGHDVREVELVGEVIDMTLQYLDQKYCPPSLQSHIVRLVIEEIKTMCRKQPEACGLRALEKTYAPLKLMQAVTGKVNEICQRYLENSRLALLPPPPGNPLPQTTVRAIRNSRRRMEDRHVILHDLNSIFSIQDDSTSSYYAVFDGHMGPEAAVYCAAHLHQYLAESVHYPTDPERALRDAFITTDAHFVQKCQDHGINSGATAVCALIVNRKLYVAWAGDSQAALAKRGNVTQLVNPHKPDRVDEKDRVIRMGGSVMHYGMWRGNGNLAGSRAIGDPQYKPYVTGDPEIRCVILDGSEDFLVIACDGLWDHIDETTAAGIVYQQVCRDPQDLEAVSQRLVDYSKNKGSFDNITVIVVFLTPPNQIATRFTHNHPLIADVELNNMEPDNRYFSSPTGQYDVNSVNSSFGKPVRNQNNGGAFDEDEFTYTKSSNGRHENGAVNFDEEEDDGEEDDDDDLGPESNVDAVDEAGDVCTLANVSRELFPELEKPLDLLGDGGQVPGNRNTGEKNEHDAENVGDSEDSDDEWNYYRADPDKVKNSTTEGSRAQVSRDYQRADSLKEREREIEKEKEESSDSEVESEGREAIKIITDPEIREPPSLTLPSPPVRESSPTPEDMDFQLNPNAAEFIPVSPAPNIPTRILDMPISGSPLKPSPMMDDIRVPSPSEFQEEVSHRPSEIEDKIVSPQNGELETEKTDPEKIKHLLDESDVSSTRVEFGDESTASFLTNPDYHRNTGLDASCTSSCSAFDNDPMIMSFGPGDFNPLTTSVDLNAVHDLTDADLMTDGNCLDDEKDNEVHPELADLISPDSDQPKPSDAFPDHQVRDIFDNITQEMEQRIEQVSQQMEERIEEVGHAMEVRIEQVSQEVEAMNLKNSNCEEINSGFNGEKLTLGEENGDERPSGVSEIPLEGEKSPLEVESPMEVKEKSQEVESPVEVAENLLEIKELSAEVKENPLEVEVPDVPSPQDVGMPPEVRESPLQVPDTFDLMSYETINENLEEIEGQSINQINRINENSDRLPETAFSPSPEVGLMEEMGVAPLETSDEPQSIQESQDLLCTFDKPEEPVIKLSESLQEFTGLEEQFNPLEKDSGVATPVVEDLKPEEELPQLSSPSPVVEDVSAPLVEDKVEEVLVKPLESKLEELSVQSESISSTEVPEVPAVPAIPEVQAVAPQAAAQPEKEKTKAKLTSKPAKPPTKTSKPEVKSLKPTPTSPSKVSPRVPPTKKPSPRPAVKSTAPVGTTAPAKPSKPPTKAPLPRVAPIPPKSKPTGLVSSRLTATKTSVTDKKSPGVVNGDIKAKPKVAPSKAPLKPTTDTRPTTAPPKPKAPLTTAKTLPPSTAGVTKPQRPKTAPSTSTTTTRTRVLSVTATSGSSKSPAVDKQIKETANKQISSSRTTKPSTLKKTSVTSTTSTTTTTARRVTSSIAAKKPIGKTGKTGVVNGKTAPKAITKGKMQNGVCEGNAEDVKGNEDVPQKDVSPVDTTNDNQLIITAE